MVFQLSAGHERVTQYVQDGMHTVADAVNKLKVRVLRTACYRNGGIRVVSDNDQFIILPVDKINELLISATEDMYIVILKAKIKVPRLEAKAMVDHLMPI